MISVMNLLGTSRKLEYLFGCRPTVHIVDANHFKDGLTIIVFLFHLTNFLFHNNFAFCSAISFDFMVALII
jgi:hypothetical protein